VPSATLKADYPHETRHYSAFPPPSHNHSSLAFPPPPFHPSPSHDPVLRSSISPSMEGRSPRRSSSHRNTTPYGISATFSRPRRSRPEPYQLEALKQLYKQTSTPTIEERSALALEIGMYVNIFSRTPDKSADILNVSQGCWKGHQLVPKSQADGSQAGEEIWQ
jgi:Homeodomain